MVQTVDEHWTPAYVRDNAGGKGGKRYVQYAKIKWFVIFVLLFLSFFFGLFGVATFFSVLTDTGVILVIVFDLVICFHLCCS